MPGCFWRRCAAVLFCLMMFRPIAAPAAERVKLDTRPGIKVDLYVEGESSFRLSAEHMTDLAKIVDFARGRFGGPVLIVGMSRGSISLAALLQARPRVANAAPIIITVSKARRPRR